ncbi:MAG: shikimate kinase [Gilvibacter sp.]
MIVVLLGYMGSGKSLIGKNLAQTLGCDFIDLDQFIAQRNDMTISQIFSQKGEIFFRKQESLLLNELLKDNKKLVLATGGGTPCYGTNMQNILKASNAFSVYLKTSVPELAERLFPEKEGRPLIAHLNSKDALIDFIRKHIFDRSPYYMQAQLRIDTDQKRPKEIVREVVARLF